MTGAITQAVRERLERPRSGGGEAGMAKRIRAIAVDMRARPPDEFLAVDHGDLLYDEKREPVSTTEP